MSEMKQDENELSNKLEEDLDNFNYSLDNNNISETINIKKNKNKKY